jgi:predicted porin
MSASFWLEAGVNTNNQASGAALPGLAGGQGLTFNRRSTVSLAGGFGEIRLGRDYTPQFWNLAFFDPFGTLGVGTTQTINSTITGATVARASNSIGYFLPGNLGGFYGQVMYYLGENNSGAANEKDGGGLGARFGFANGPFSVALALSKTKYLAGDVQQNNIAGRWDFGMAKLMGKYSRDKAGSVTGKGGLIGALVPVGAGEIRAAYSMY